MTQLSDASGLIFSKDKLDLPETPEVILEVLRGVLAKPFIQNITIDINGGSVVCWYRHASDSLTESVSIETSDSVLDSIELVDSNYSGPPKSQIFDGLSEGAFAGYIPTHILCGSTEGFKKWLGVPGMVRFPKAGVRNASLFMGFLIEETAFLPDDSIVLCGCRVRTVGLESIVFGVRILMES